MGNPATVVRKRFDGQTVDFLLKLKWWDWSAEKIFDNHEVLCSGDISKIKALK